MVKQLCAVLLAALVFSGCDEPTPVVNYPASEITGVRVTSLVNQLLPGETTTLDAEVLGIGFFDKAVSWTVQGGGSLSATTGTRVVYTAPETLDVDTDVTVTAASGVSPDKFGVVTLFLKAPRITKIELSAADSTLFAQELTVLDVQLTGVGHFNRELSWTVTGGGTLSTTTGERVVYTAPTTVDADTRVIVTVTSVRTPDVSASIELSLQAPVVTAVAVTAFGEELFAKESVELEAALTGEGPFSSEVRWSVTGGGTLSATTGARVTYTAPDVVSTDTSVTVTATSVQTPSRSSSATLTLKAPRVTAVRVEGTDTELFARESVALDALVTGEGGPFSTEVRWSVTGGGSLSATTGARISYTAPATVSADTTVTVTATSVVDGSKAGSLTLTLNAPWVTEVRVTGTDTELFAKESVALDAVVTGEGPFSSEVRWSVTGGGSLSATTGARVSYTAPDVVSTDTFVTVTATSVQTPSRSASVTLTLKSPRVTGVRVEGADTELFEKESVALDAVVTGEGGPFSTEVHWSVTGGGTLSATTGARVSYTAPATVSADTTVTVTAMSVADGSKAGSLTLTLKAAQVTGVQVSVGRTQLVGGNSVVFAATVSGTGPFNPAVAWKLVSGSGALEALALDPSRPNIRLLRYTAPRGASVFTATIQATSGANPTLFDAKSVQVLPVLLSIAEVSPTTLSGVLNWPGWLELRNNTSEPIQLGDYALRAEVGDPIIREGTGTIDLFPLPSRTLAPGAHIVVSGLVSSLRNFDSEQAIWLKNGAEKIPTWSDHSIAELVRKDIGETVDFIRFGSSRTPPLSEGAWTGTSNVPWVSTIVSASVSFVRTPSADDTNSASDWSLRAFPTPAGPNDVPAGAVDADSDGIPDSAEVAGGRFAGMDLYLMGARTGQRDIFIELDHMRSTDPGILPRKESLDKLVAVFAGRGIRVHIDAGTRFSSSFNPASYNLGQGSPELPFATSISFDRSAGAASGVYELKAAHMNFSRRAIFHYCIFGSSQRLDGRAGSSGVAEFLGNDLVVTLGSWGLSTATVEWRNQLINYQASTLMHEFGHNLNLQHGGNVSTNDKPNYLSVMNYLYQLRGLGPVSGSSAGDRYYYNWGIKDYGLYDLVDSPMTDTFVMDFSDGTGSSIDENAVNEGGGLGRPGSTSVDYDNSGAISTSAYDVNRDGVFGVLKDYNDWANIVLPFSLHRGAISFAPMLSTPYTQISILHDQQPIAEEEPPPLAFFEELRRMRDMR
ncbi:hypothetical protein [Archangium violaceum]|uniref:hypothetical protein n=1 Tax=Archangium violaceum TaxID=83451 RepID=UPI0036D822E1